MEKKMKRSRLGLAGEWIRTVAPVVGVIIAILIAMRAIPILVYPEITVETPPAEVTIPETWHQSHVSDTTGDWMGPFLLTGEKASISWMMKEGTIQSGEQAELCYAQNSTCINAFVEVGVPTELNLLDGVPPDEGWYYLHYTPATGPLKTVEVYLYFGS